MSGEFLAGAVCAESALERTNHGGCGLGRELLVAAFATGAQRKHGLDSRLNGFEYYETVALFGKALQATDTGDLLDSPQ
jgi:hypothetical protein